MIDVNEETYRKLIQQDIDHLDKIVAEGFEIEHIKMVLNQSIELLYREQKTVETLYHCPDCDRKYPEMAGARACCKEL